MSFEAFIFKQLFNYFDKKKLKGLKTPDDVERCDNLSYGEHGEWNLLDVYYPKGATQPLPTIVSIHGGGYIYGNKEVYQFYCMNLAQRGFTVVNFNYRLAPSVLYPSILTDVNKVMQWVCSNADQYNIDVKNVFFVGDSVGAQMASQYSAIVTNTEYAKMFDFEVPPFKLRAIGLNCGIYDKPNQGKGLVRRLFIDYFKKNSQQHNVQLDVLEYITIDYPATHITSAPNDVFYQYAEPMHELLTSKGINSECKIYGTKEQREIAHVFHCDIHFPEATQCNDDQCNYFKQFIAPANYSG
jgi:predicted alpha/beta-fold hydrolase